MKPRASRPKPRSPKGFTLLELLLAASMFAVVVVPLFAVFHGALRMQEKAYGAMEEQAPRHYVALVIRRDLAGILPPVGVMAGPLIGEKGEEGRSRVDRLEFRSANASLDAGDPWGDIQKVEYHLVRPEDQPRAEGWDLIRTVTRNLLRETEEEVQEERLARDVQSLELSYYDGENWQDAWDSTTKGNELPKALRILIGFTARDDGHRAARPLQLLVPVLVDAEVAEE